MNTVFPFSLLRSSHIVCIICFVLGVICTLLMYSPRRLEKQISKKYSKELSQQQENYQYSLNSFKSKAKITIKSLQQTIAESHSKIEVMENKIQSLEKKQKTEWIKITNKDGSTEERQITETETKENSSSNLQSKSEYDSKVKSIEEQYSKKTDQTIQLSVSKFKKKEKAYLKELSELHEKITATNQYSAQIGLLNNSSKFLNFSRNFIGPIDIGVQLQQDVYNNYNYGVSLGLSF